MLIRFDVPSTVEELFEDASVRTIIAPNTDVHEGENETVVLMEMPGVEKSAVQVSFERGVLSVSGERKPASDAGNVRVLLQERSARMFRRAIRIHHPVEAAGITATLEDGMLRVALPKAEVAKPRVIAVR